MYCLYKPSEFNVFPISHQHLLIKSLLQCYGSLGSQIAGRFSTSVICPSKSIFLQALVSLQQICRELTSQQARVSKTTFNQCEHFKGFVLRIPDKV